MSLTKLFPRCLAGALLFALSCPVAVSATPGETSWQEARNLYDRQKTDALVVMAPRHTGHLLSDYLHYWPLSVRLAQDDPTASSDVANFIAPREGQYLADRLRREWLKSAARRDDWALFDQQWPQLIYVEDALECRRLQRDAMLGQRAALETLHGRWHHDSDTSESCTKALEQLPRSGRLSQEAIWARFRLLVGAHKPSDARDLLALLPEKQQPAHSDQARALGDPVRYLSKLPAKALKTRAGREMALAAVVRAARKDPAAAEGLLRKLKKTLPPRDLAWAYGHIATQAAWRHLPEAMHWFAEAEPAHFSATQHAWHARAALRAKDWTRVISAIEAMPIKQQGDPEWRYWLGRAYQAHGLLTQAHRLFQFIAGQPDFYGTLAAEELGRKAALPPAAAINEDHVSALRARPEVQRAIACFENGLRIEGVREWNWAIRGLDDAQLLAAAELARREGIWDRAINTSEKTRQVHDFSQRYLAPEHARVAPAAQAQGLDDAWVYGLMRQESRFITDISSHAGARGLMQLMPRTARWVARKIGLADYNPDQLNDPEVNVLLGTSYMRMVMDDLDQHPVLASAGYNAGPGRAQRWRDNDVALEGAIYAETIPFDETRDYVKKVMSNAVYYSLVFRGRPDSLKDLLGHIPPRQGRGAPDLP